MDNSTVGTVVNALMFAADVAAITYSLYWASRDRRTQHIPFGQPTFRQHDTADAQEAPSPWH